MFLYGLRGGLCVILGFGEGIAVPASTVPVAYCRELMSLSVVILKSDIILDKAQFSASNSCACLVWLYFLIVL